MTLWNQTYRARGDFASKIAQLSADEMFNLGGSRYYFFDRYVDVVECGALVGFKEYNDPEKYNDAMKKYVDSGKDGYIEIPINTILKEERNLKLLFRMIVLNEKVSSRSLREKTDCAFRQTSDSPEQKSSEDMFNNFVKLGVDLLYERVVKAKDAESCLDIMREFMPGDD